MGRHAPGIAAASLAFLAGLLTAGGDQNLAYALSLSLLAFFIVKIFQRLELDLHFLLVAVMCFLLWAAGLSVLLSHFSVEGRSCVLDSTHEGKITPVDVNGEARLPPAGMPPPETSDHSCGGADVSPHVINSFWAGVVDRKTTAKPSPHYPPIAKAARAEGTVAVWVLVDESGRVIWARAISGHPLLQPPAANAACLARFSPIFVSAPPIRVSGILTYRFKP